MCGGEQKSGKKKTRRREVKGQEGAMGNEGEGSNVGRNEAGRREEGSIHRLRIMMESKMKMARREG